MNYDQQIERMYHPENFEPDFTEAEEEFTDRLGRLPMDDDPEWEEVKEEYV